MNALDNSHLFDKKSDYFRIFLDLPYRYGAKHLSAAWTGKIVEIAKNIEQESSNEKTLNFKERAYHLAVGIGECTPLIGIIVTIAVEYFGGLKKENPSRLIESHHEIKPHQEAFYLHLALLRSAYEKATGHDKKQIQFLAANFLSKITPKQLDIFGNSIQSADPNYINGQQSSPLEEYRYHRECIEQHLEYGKEYHKQLAYSEDGLFILTDTTECAHFFPLKFTVINEELDYSDILYNLLKDHVSKNNDQPFEKPLSSPILIDTTNFLKNIQIKEEFKTSFEQFKQKFNQDQQIAITRYLQENPNEKQETLQKYLDDNITCISRVQLDGVSGIKMLPIGSCSTKEKQFKSPLISFIINRGLYIGAINLRRMVSDVFQQRPDIKYGVVNKKEDTLYFEKKTDFIDSPSFNRLLSLFGSQPISSAASNSLQENVKAIEKIPHIKVLGKATVDMLSGLIKELDDTKWEELKHSEVFQTTLFLIKEHLARGELAAITNNFNTFAQEIELVQAHLATLLELTHPFKEADFGSIYKDQLKDVIPIGMEGMVKAGLGKTAVNIFSGIASIAKGESSEIGIHSQGTYFEQAMLMEHWFDWFIENPEFPKQNLYVCQYNSNVDVGSTLTNYKRRDIGADVKRLLDNDRVTDKFTVAVDITIEHMRSENVKELLAQFENEIKEGKVNFIFFSSGQKFYTLGMDNYYGAYFYTVNNGDKKWEAFDSLLTHPVHRPDILSVQWFCLVTKYASDSLGVYRDLIFKNSRTILDGIPQSLHPKTTEQKLRVNTVDPKMTPCFIDLKVLRPKSEQEAESQRIRNLFFKQMADKNIIGYSRGSFGFYHQNFAVFGELDDAARTIRLNPSINPEENAHVIEFFQQLH